MERMYQITINDITVDVRRKKIKNLYLSFIPATGKVRLSVPWRLDDETVKKFIVSKLSWIDKRQKKFSSHLVPLEPHPVMDKHQFYSLIETLLEKWEKIINVKTTGFRIRKMKSRWGSCNIRTRQICLNSNLAKFPPPCLEYVIVHELVHLLEASHNARFKQLMTQFMPKWKVHKATLNGYT